MGVPAAEEDDGPLTPPAGKDAHENDAMWYTRSTTPPVSLIPSTQHPAPHTMNRERRQVVNPIVPEP